MSSRNRHSQELCEQIATQDSNCHPRFSHCEHYVIRWREDIYPATHIITDCTQLLQQTKKRLRNKILSHIINVLSLSDDVSWQDTFFMEYSVYIISGAQLHGTGSRREVLYEVP